MIKYPIVGANHSPGVSNSFPLKQHSNNGNISNVKMAMPSQFYPSSNTSLFSSARNAYINNVGRGPLPTTESNAIYTKKKKWNNISSSQLIYLKRVNAIGKSSIQSPQTLQELSFRSQDTTSRNDALRRCRSGGCVAPKKKGANRDFKSGGSSILTSIGNRQIIAP
jgi:hypothetical protein